MLPYVNIAAYKFITLHDTLEKRPEFLSHCRALDLKGTILLSPEGINLFLAGLCDNIHTFIDWLCSNPHFTDIPIKKSFSKHQPFTRMLVKLKPEIITMKEPLIQPEKKRAPTVSPKTLKRWLDQMHDDENRPIVMMDTRNHFEVTVGTFDGAIDCQLTQFSEFPTVASAHLAHCSEKTVVTFCTGGIRCEKAAIHMQNIGYSHVYQLDGGILKYFEECGGAHYHGNCFVFDYRTALNAQLEETDTVQCYACRGIVRHQEQLLPSYIPGKSCLHCTSRMLR